MVLKDRTSRKAAGMTINRSISQAPSPSVLSLAYLLATFLCMTPIYEIVKWLEESKAQVKTWYDALNLCSWRSKALISHVPFSYKATRRPVRT